MASNLPPGVTEGMLPGNRPEDMAWDEAMEKINEMAIEAKISPEDLVRAFGLGAAQLSMAAAAAPPVWKTVKDAVWFHSMVPDYLYGIVLVETDHGEHKAYLGKAEGSDMLVDRETILAETGAPVRLAHLAIVMDWLSSKTPPEEYEYPEGGDPGEVVSDG